MRSVGNKVLISAGIDDHLSAVFFPTESKVEQHWLMLFASDGRERSSKSFSENGANFPLAGLLFIASVIIDVIKRDPTNPTQKIMRIFLSPACRLLRVSCLAHTKGIKQILLRK